jgi:hypothetical protein
VTGHKRSAARSLLALLSVVALTMTFAVSAVSADDAINVTDYSLGQGFENPCGEDAAVKLDESDIAEGEHTYTFEGLELELVLNATFGEGNEIDSVEVISISGGAANQIYVHAGEGTTLQLVEGMTIDPEKGISFVLFCVGDEGTGGEEFSPTLSLEKVVTAGDANLGFSFTLGGVALDSAVKASDAAKLLAEAAGSYTIVELDQPGWNVSAIDCVGNAAAETAVTATGTVTVTVGEDEDVVCTFTNSPEGTQSGNPPSPKPSTPPSTAPRGGVQAGVPNTAMDVGTGDSMPVVLALVAIAGLAIVGRQNIKEMLNRR